LHTTEEKGSERKKEIPWKKKEVKGRKIKDREEIRR
jgi:hypothetical protein